MPSVADASLRPPFSQVLEVEEVPPEGLDMTISATEPECQAIADENGLQAVGKLEGDLHIAPWHKGGLAVTGEMRARVTQICVVSLDPFDSEIVEPIDVKFAPVDVAEMMPPSRRGLRVARGDTPTSGGAALAAEDPPDPIIDGRIDVGALVAEFLALSLDPYPRKPGVEFQESEPAAPADESPFAKLEVLKGRSESRS